MKTVLAWIQRFRWVAWVVLAAVIAAGTLILRRMFAGPPSPEEQRRFAMPAVPEAVARQVARAEERASVSRIQASAQAEAKKEELQQVLQIPDGDDGGKARRARLAAMLRTL